MGNKKVRNKAGWMVKWFYYTQIELQCFNVIEFQQGNSGMGRTEPSFSRFVRFMDTEIYGNI